MQHKTEYGCLNGVQGHYNVLFTLSSFCFRNLENSSLILRAFLNPELDLNLAHLLRECPRVHFGTSDGDNKNRWSRLTVNAIAVLAGRIALPNENAQTCERRLDDPRFSASSESSTMNDSQFLL